MQSITQKTKYTLLVKNTSDLPKVSIITPLFNREELIKETIGSIINQTYQNWECIIVDDHSTDGSVECATFYRSKDHRIKVVTRNRSPKGAPTCRNIGLEKSTGELILFLDSDDLLAPFCLEQRIEIYKKNKTLDFLGFPMLLFKNKPYDLNIYTNIETDESHLLRYLRGDNIWQTSQIIWTKSALNKLKGFDESLTIGQETDLHIRALIKKLNYNNYFEMEPDCFCRQHDGYRIGNSKNQLDKAISIEKLLDFLISNFNNQLKDKKIYKNLVVRIVNTTIFYLEIGEKECARKVSMKINMSIIDRLIIKLLVVLYSRNAHKLIGFYRLRNLMIYPYIKNSTLMKVKYEPK